MLIENINYALLGALLVRSGEKRSSEVGGDEDIEDEEDDNKKKESDSAEDGEDDLGDANDPLDDDDDLPTSDIESSDW